MPPKSTQRATVDRKLAKGNFISVLRHISNECQRWRCGTAKLKLAVWCFDEIKTLNGF